MFLLCIWSSCQFDSVECCTRTSLEEEERVWATFQSHDMEVVLFVLKAWEDCFARLWVNRVHLIVKV